MSTHYLISPFNGEINDVVVTPLVATDTLITGNYVVRVPDDVPVSNPTNLADLLTKKYAGTLGVHGLFTQIAYDDMLDGTGVSTGPSAGVTAGDGGSVSIYPVNGAFTPVFQSTALPITWGGGGSGPSQVMVTYELFEFVDTDDKTAAYQRVYREVTPDSDVTLAISFDNGANFITTVDKAITNIPLVAQGTQVVFRLTRTSNISVRGRVYLGSWAVLF